MGEGAAVAVSGAGVWERGKRERRKRWGVASRLRVGRRLGVIWALGCVSGC